MKEKEQIIAKLDFTEEQYNKVRLARWPATSHNSKCFMIHKDNCSVKSNNDRISYSFSWDGGDLSRHHRTFLFDNDDTALTAAKSFMREHGIRHINVFVGKGKHSRHIGYFR